MKNNKTITKIKFNNRKTGNLYNRQTSGAIYRLAVGGFRVRESLRVSKRNGMNIQIPRSPNSTFDRVGWWQRFSMAKHAAWINDSRK